MRKQAKEWWQDLQETRALKRHIRQEKKRYKPHIDAAGDDEDYRSVVIDDYLDSINDSQIALEHKKTFALISRAKRLGIDVPLQRDQWYWERITLGGQKYKLLSNMGELQLRRLIRKEQREDKMWWLAIIGALTGLLGVILSLLTTLKLV